MNVKGAVLGHYTPEWPEEFAPLPPPEVYQPMTVKQFRYMSSVLSMLQGQSLRREDAGKEPLPPFHPIAMKALPRLRSLERRYG